MTVLKAARFRHSFRVMLATFFFGLAAFALIPSPVNMRTENITLRTLFRAGWVFDLSDGEALPMQDPTCFGNSARVPLRTEWGAIWSCVEITEVSDVTE